MSETARSVASNYLQALLDHGIEYVFANAGTDFAPIIEALVYARNNGIRTPEFITVPHENVAIAMAHGYFLETGKPAAVMVHVTVGTANALCGLMNAARDQAPILLTAGCSPSTEKGHIGSRNASIHWGQDSFDQGGMVREWVKWDYELRPGQPPEEIVGRALDIAMSEPKGPVYLSMPREVLGDLTEEKPEPPRGRKLGSLPATPSLDGIRQTAEWIAESQCPLIITSSTGRNPDSFHKLSQIAETYGIGVAMPGEPGAREISISTTHPMFSGVHPTELLSLADVLISLDCEVPWWPNEVKVRQDAKQIHISADPMFSRYPVRGFQMDLAIAGSSNQALHMLETALEESCAQHANKVKTRQTLLQILSEGRSRRHHALVKDMEQRSPIHAARVAQCVNEVINEDTVIVNEMGVPLNFLDLSTPRSYFSSSLAGGLGFGLGAALGVKMGNRAKQVILIVGDGSYMFGCPTAAHHTASMYGLPTTTIVMNNSKWNAVHRSTLGMYPNGLAAKAEQMPLVSLGTSPEYQDIMKACGGYGEKVESAFELKAALQRCLQMNAEGKSALLNVITGD